MTVKIGDTIRITRSQSAAKVGDEVKVIDVQFDTAYYCNDNDPGQVYKFGSSPGCYEIVKQKRLHRKNRINKKWLKRESAKWI